jgi:hypothetical protein
MVAGLHELQPLPGATVSYPEHSGRRGAGSVGHRDRYKPAYTTCRASLAATRNVTWTAQGDTPGQRPGTHFTVSGRVVQGQGYRKLTSRVNLGYRSLERLSWPKALTLRAKREEE